MRSAHACAIAVLAALFAIAPAPLFAVAAEPAQPPDYKALHAGRAGIYVRFGKKEQRERQLVEHNPLIDAVLVTAWWQDVEGVRGKYVFGELKRDVEQWGKAGKGVVIMVGWYGYDSHVAEALRSARERLKKNDEAIFGKAPNPSR